MLEKNKEIVRIINDFEFKIKKSLKNTSYQEREDLEREIKTKIIEKVHSVQFGEAPSFWWIVKNKQAN
jgi:hypothetical protein